MLIVGIALLIIGYFIALITYDPNSSTPIFWFGFLLVLGSKQLAKPENYWTKGAKWGLFASVLVYLAIVIIAFMANWYLENLLYFFSPISHIADTFSLSQYIQNPAGRITDITTLIFAVTYNFLDICIYISIGAFIGKLSINKKEANLSPMLKIGLVVLIIGYLIGLRTQNPNSSTPVFWLGLLLVLRSKQLANPEKYWTKGAMLGLLGHALVYVILIIFWNGGKGFIGYLSYAYRPITFIAEKFSPTQYINSDITTLILAVTYNLLNICTYISIGILIGKLLIKQKRSQPIN